MAKKKAPSAASLAADEGVVIPRITLAPQGFTALRTSNGRILAEANQAFNYPYFVKTVNEMRHNPTVGSAMSAYRMLISRVNWRVEAHKEATDIDKERAALVGTMMNDMEHSWRSFIEEVIPYLEYGFGIHEKVLRRRLPRNGSIYSDGLVGIRKLAPRNQDTIERWNFSEDGADLIGVSQSIANVENSYRFANRKDENGLIPIDREKFLLFTASGNKGNPQGNSLYKAIYLAYKTLSMVQDQELLGAAKDIQGILKIEVPPNYLAVDANESEQAVAASLQGIVDQYADGTLKGLVLPQQIDSESKLPLFSYSLIESRGAAKYNLEEIIQRIQLDILSALNVDVLKLGSSGSGSFSLAESKTSILAIAIDYRLREIAEVLNTDLMKSIYAANGWSQERMASFVYGDIEEVSWAEAGKLFRTSGVLELWKQIVLL